MKGYNRIERAALRIGTALVRWANRHFHRRMAGTLLWQRLRQWVRERM